MFSTASSPPVPQAVGAHTAWRDRRFGLFCLVSIWMSETRPGTQPAHTWCKTGVCVWGGVGSLLLEKHLHTKSLTICGNAARQLEQAARKGVWIYVTSPRTSDLGRDVECVFKSANVCARVYKRLKCFFMQFVYNSLFIFIFLNDITQLPQPCTDALQLRHKSPRNQAWRHETGKNCKYKRIKITAEFKTGLKKINSSKRTVHFREDVES